MLRVLPANQRFDRNDRQVRKIHNRLVVDQQFMGFDGLTQFVRV